MVNIEVTKVNVEPSGSYKVNLEFDGFSNNDIVIQIGADELLAEMEISDVLKHFDLSDLLDGVNDLEKIKNYLKDNGETEL